MPVMDSVTFVLKLRAWDHPVSQSSSGQLPAGRGSLARVAEAEEVCVLSSTRNAIPVVAVGDVLYQSSTLPGSQIAALREAIAAVLPQFD